MSHTEPAPLGVTRDQVVSLLEQARAPKPWKNPDWCEAVALQMTYWTDQIHQRRFWRKIPKTPTYFEIAQNAIDQLRWCIPKLIDFNSQYQSSSFDPGVHFKRTVEQQIWRLKLL